MKSPKKRKIPKAKRSQHLKRIPSHAQDLHALPIMRIAKQTELDVLSQTLDLEMEYSIEENHKQLDQFFSEYGFTRLERVFIPESVICKAHNYGELIIALKMQQVDCSDWKVEVTGNFYNTVTEAFEDVPYSKELNGVSYIEIYKGMPIKIERGHGVKTRWRGLEDELKRHFDDKGYTKDKGWYRGNTIVKFTGQCRFKNIELYEEFMFMRDVISKGNIEKFFEALDQDSIETGRVNEKMQPINANEVRVSIPYKVKDYFLKKFSMENFGEKYKAA